MLANFSVFVAQGSSVRSVLEGIPHDAAAILVYVFVIASLLLIWRGSRTRS